MNPRAVLAVAIVAGATYVVSGALDLPTWAEVIWKGAGVGLLALYAAVAARGPDRPLLVAVMAFGALGDVLLEVFRIEVGAIAFLAGHLTAIVLYLRNRRRSLSPAELAFAAALVPLITVIAFLLPPNRAAASGIALYALGLSAMAATAWLSRFPRRLVAAGALMFAASDLLIFLRGDRPQLDVLPMALAVWGLYFAGQAMIATGVARTRAATVS